MTATLTRRRSRGRRALDWDGCVSGIKNSVDGLVDGGVLTGDDPKRLCWCGVEQSWGVADFVTFRVGDDLAEVAA